MVKEVLSGSERISEEKFDCFGYPVDADRDGTEHSPSTSFTTQLSQQRAVILTQPKVMAEFRQHLFDGAANKQEHQRLKDLQEERWRTEELRLNVDFTRKLHKKAGRDEFSDRSHLQDDTPDPAMIAGFRG